MAEAEINLKRLQPQIIMVLNKSDLTQFTGATRYYKHLTGLLYTDGVQYVAEQGKVYRLLLRRQMKDNQEKRETKLD